MNAATRTDARRAAFLAVRDALAGERYVGDALRALRNEAALDDRDAALAAEIALGAVRHAVTIEHVLSAVATFDRHRTPRDLLAILYTATYQIIWMHRVPIFAAVDQAVELARQRVHGRAPGMVNAVLRKLTRAIAQRRTPWQRLSPRHVRVSWDQAAAFAVDVLPELDETDAFAAHLAAATGERLPRYRQLVVRFGAQPAEEVAWASRAVPVTVLQRNALRCTAGEFEERCRAELAEEMELAGDAAFLPAGASVASAPSFTAGLAFVQDPTAHAAALLVNAQPGERVLDLCAAPGGKSVALAIQMQNRGEVVACDASVERLARVRENISRLGLTCVRVAETTSLAQRDDFDAALVDVPCTNTGVIARRPEARLGLTARKLQALVTVQRELLQQAAAHVRPAGRLIYSTCSLEQEENQQQVAQFLADYRDWRLDCEQSTLPHWGPRLSDWHDGGYAARLLRT